MLKLRRILCPTDFSEPSYQALRQALEMLTPEGAELYLLHVLPPSAAEPDDTFTEGDTAAVTSAAPLPQIDSAEVTDSAEVQQCLRELVRDFIPQRLKTHLKVHCLVRRSDVTSEILHAAKAEAIDLIVMATHGRTGWREFVLGSVTDEVVRLAPCPVFTIGNAARHQAGLELSELGAG